jgi:hypothetical protein
MFSKLKSIKITYGAHAPGITSHWKYPGVFLYECSVSPLSWSQYLSDLDGFFFSHLITSLSHTIVKKNWHRVSKKNQKLDFLLGEFRYFKNGRFYKAIYSKNIIETDWISYTMLLYTQKIKLSVISDLTKGVQKNHKLHFLLVKFGYFKMAHFTSQFTLRILIKQNII